MGRGSGSLSDELRRRLKRGCRRRRSTRCRCTVLPVWGRLQLHLHRRMSVARDSWTLRRRARCEPERCGILPPQQRMQGEPRLHWWTATRWLLVLCFIPAHTARRSRIVVGESALCFLNTDLLSTCTTSSPQQEHKSKTLLFHSSCRRLRYHPHRDDARSFASILRVHCGGTSLSNAPVPLR